MKRVQVGIVLGWHHMWVGLHWDRKARRLYILPVPCVGLFIEFRSTVDVKLFGGPLDGQTHPVLIEVVTRFGYPDRIVIQDPRNPAASVYYDRVGEAGLVTGPHYYYADSSSVAPASVKVKN